MDNEVQNHVQWKKIATVIFFIQMSLEEQLCSQRASISKCAMVNSGNDFSSVSFNYMIISTLTCLLNSWYSPFFFYSWPIYGTSCWLILWNVLILSTIALSILGCLLGVCWTFFLMHSLLVPCPLASWPYGEFLSSWSSS